MRAFLFPGQGSQAVGMGAALAGASETARRVFEEVDEALGQNLFRLMREGPEDELKLTENAQPAIMALLAHADQSGPVLRGVFFRERVLCLEVDPPPPDVVVYE